MLYLSEANCFGANSAPRIWHFRKERRPACRLSYLLGVNQIGYVGKYRGQLILRSESASLFLSDIAIGAYVGALNLAVNLNGDLLDVRTEGAVAYAMRVADATTSNRCLTADLAYFGHS